MLLIDWICNTVNWGIAVSEIDLARVTINVLINHKLIYILKCIHSHPKTTEAIRTAGKSMSPTHYKRVRFIHSKWLRFWWLFRPRITQCRQVFKPRRLSKQIRLCLRSGVIGDDFIFVKYYRILIGHLLCIQSFIVHLDFPERIAVSQLQVNPKALVKMWPSLYPQRTTHDFP